MNILRDFNRKLLKKLYYLLSSLCFSFCTLKASKIQKNEISLTAEYFSVNTLKKYINYKSFYLFFDHELQVSKYKKFNKKIMCIKSKLKFEQ